jgi:REP element-mobilizing transposase RayT
MKFLDTLAEAKKASGFKLLGYCLMGNHVHLLLAEGDEGIASIFKRIGVRYVTWYNRKYGRCGPLFQGRFKSEAVENDEYLLSALRYIHRNPVKAGLCGTAGDYRWSSYGDYVGTGRGITDTETILALFASEGPEQTAAFESFMNEGGCEGHVDTDKNSEAALRERMSELCGVGTAASFQALPAERRDSNIRALRSAGMSIRQITRLTGIPFGIVRRKRG